MTTPLVVAALLLGGCGGVLGRVAPPPPPASPPNPPVPSALARAHYLAGRRALETGDLPAAEGAFRDALRLAPGSAWIGLGLAEVAAAAGDPAEALRRGREALGPEAAALPAPPLGAPSLAATGADPLRRAAWVRLGALADAAGEDAVALAAWRAVVPCAASVAASEPAGAAAAAAPDPAGAAVPAGVLDPAGTAAAASAPAWAPDPSDPDPDATLAARAAVCLADGDLDAARLAAARMLGRDPGASPAMRARALAAAGAVEYASGDAARALASWEEACRLAPPGAGLAARVASASRGLGLPEPVPCAKERPRP